MKKRILVIDDSEDIVQLLKFKLEKAGYEVISSYSGIDGLTKARNFSPDLILLDVFLPKINGFKICRMLKFDKRFKDIPIIMLTARGREVDRNKGFQMGVDEYIHKPFDANLLLEKIEYYIN